MVLEFNFNFGFWERLTMNVNKDIEKDLYALLGLQFF